MVGPLALQPLGQTGLSVSPIGLGTVKLGRIHGVKYPTPARIPDDDEARQLLDTARRLGINLLDTAPAYGTSEERLGGLLAGTREHWVLCTKVGETFDGTHSHFDFTPESCRQSVQTSLKRLRTDFLDIVLIHSDGHDLDILRLGTLQALQALQTEGKVRAVGLSHKTVAGAEAAVEQGADVIMATLNRDHTDELTVIRESAERGCGVLIKKALQSGHGRAEDLRWVAGQTGVHSIVVGTTDPGHLEENVRVLSS